MTEPRLHIQDWLLVIPVLGGALFIGFLCALWTGDWGGAERKE